MLLAVVVTALLAFPMGIVLASHQFSDVPSTNPFHGDIDALVDSGVTAGCGSGKYCPKANVTREQMAAFLNRLGALAPGKPPVVNADRIDGLDSSAFSRPMYAVVNANGTLARGVAVSSSVQQSSPGRYVVAFNRSIQTCAFTGTLGSVAGGFSGTGTIVVAFSDSSATNDLFIETRDLAGALADRSFHLQVSCAAAEGAVTGSGPDVAVGAESNAP